MSLLSHAVALLCVASLASAQFSVPGATETAVRSDIKYIRCGVCEALAKNAHRQVKALRDELRPGKKLSEIAILETVEKLTNPVQPEGEWITKIDLVEQGDQLAVVEQSEAGVCGSECKTVQKAAEEILGDNDTDLGELLWKGEAGRAGATKWLCQEVTAACRKPAPPMPKGRKPGPVFKAVDPEELKMQRMMADMEAQGMKGSLYNRDEAMRMAGGMGGDEDADEDEDEDDDASSKPSAGGILGNLQQTVSDASQGVLEKAAFTAAPLLEKASYLAGKGWSAAREAMSKLKGTSSQTQGVPHAEL